MSFLKDDGQPWPKCQRPSKTLVQDLREDAGSYHDETADYEDCWNLTARLERAAAGEIERLQAENAELKASIAACAQDAVPCRPADETSEAPTICPKPGHGKCVCCHRDELIEAQRLQDKTSV